MSNHVERYSHISVTQTGNAQSRVEVAHIEIAESFDPDTCCDEREKALINMIRNYLRPEQAPECLVQRLRNMMSDVSADSQIDEFGDGREDVSR
ncbi:hypothetical protein [Bifidobacterium sp.]|jgi:hypothetical protein|uniref:hypothetical protein n=1 Tax=Bifidobacterium sp. TaxID=41200 RepID=UPI0025C67438|nr:hypothetical protein [Bifidobacterium sp.]MCH4160557.1 hypothetical protein [Bifidobacterium sp.]MCH4174663.1 hypothetical protein [Bifidobacterium sp.]MCI1636074.1 hypothetical protein [Bifidobacterium sp.]